MEIPKIFLGVNMIELRSLDITIMVLLLCMSVRVCVLVYVCLCMCVWECCNRAAKQSQTIIAYAQPQGIPCVWFPHCLCVSIGVCVCVWGCAHAVGGTWPNGRWLA